MATFLHLPTLGIDIPITQELVDDAVTLGKMLESGGHAMLTPEQAADWEKWFEEREAKHGNACT